MLLAKGASGIVTIPPVKAHQIAENWNGVSREVDTVRGLTTFYWIQFDKRRFDPDGDGPFFGAEFDEKYLIADSAASQPLEKVTDEDVEVVWYENKTTGMKVEFKAFLKQEVPKGSDLNG